MSKQESQSESLKFASLAAHQLRGPVTAASALLKSLLGEFIGPLNHKQKELIQKAIGRCDQALESVQRMLAIAKAGESTSSARMVSDLAALARRAHVHYLEEARRQNVSLSIEIDVEPAYVQGYEPALIEVIDALMSNALKYTPEHGQVRLATTRVKDVDAIQLAVGDSGVGIPEKDRHKVFEPFFRTERVTESSRPGTGLGLAFVKSAIEAAGGTVGVQRADLGGAELILQLPIAAQPDIKRQGDSSMSDRLKVVIVGGAVAGPKAAAKIIRLRPDAQVTVLEKNQFLACAGCGLPYYMAGVVKDQKMLLSTPAGTQRDPVFFQNVKNVQVMNQTEALAIDPKKRIVRIRDCAGNEEKDLSYDKLILTTGAKPTAHAMPGANLDNVITLHAMISAERIKSKLVQGKANDVVIVGGGILGVQITECLVERGCRVTIVEKGPQLLGILDWEMAALVERHLESKGVKILTNTTVQRFEGKDKVTGVVTDRNTLLADLAVVAIGFQPNVELARKAGIVLGQTGAIKVDEHLQTSDPNIYAAGDCVETMEMITSRARYLPYGAVASKQGRVAAINVCSGDERFSGVLASAVCKVFDYCVARTGLTEHEARELGYEVTSVLVPGPDRDHYMPNARLVLLKVIADNKTRKLLGAQAIGPGMCEKRVDLAAMAITAGMTIDQVANVDLTYAPPYSQVMDNLITAVNVARNKLDGYMVGVTPMEVHRMQQERVDFVFLDVRTPVEYEFAKLPGAILITLGTLRSRLNELSKDKEIVVFSGLSLRAYEAALVLRAAGFEKVRVLDGGIEMWPYEKLQ